MTLPTVLLRHTVRSETHYDWMIESPPAGTPVTAAAQVRDDDDATAAPKLWTVRVGVPSEMWAQAEWVRITPLPLHRREYLTYEGPVSGDRGVVRRDDEGRVAVRLWGRHRMVLDVAMHKLAATVEVLLSPGGCSRLRVVEPEEAAQWFGQDPEDA